MSEMRYFKATRPDGTDCYTGTVDYGAALKSGAVLEHPAKFCRNNPATYFSVSIAPTDCTGMRWPCRLFRVEPVGRAWRNDVLPSKRCCSRLRVVEELPAHLALGPQGQEVAALIERAGRLTEDEVKRRAAAWAAATDPAGAAAWAAAGAAAETAARAAAGAAAWDAAGAAVQTAAGAAAWAAVALLTRDLITTKHFNVLYGPWASVMEEATDD